MTPLQMKAVEHSRELFDAARSKLYRHNFPKALKEQLEKNENAAIKFEIEEYLKAVQAEMSTADGWLGAVIEDGKTKP